MEKSYRKYKSRKCPLCARQISIAGAAWANHLKKHERDGDEIPRIIGARQWEYEHAAISATQFRDRLIEREVATSDLSMNTVYIWLRDGRIVGARKESGIGRGRDGRWLIPSAAAETFDPPRAGRPRLKPQETAELRQTLLHHRCRLCGRMAAPQLMRAIFERQARASWQVIAWEHLSCQHEAIIDPMRGDS